MKVRVSGATNVQLDYLAAKCGGFAVEFVDGVIYFKDCSKSRAYCNYNPSSNWSWGGLIIEREKINTEWLDDHWAAKRSCTVLHPTRNSRGYFRRTGSTQLIAAMRCYVASVLGEEVEVPNELHRGRQIPDVAQRRA